MVYNIIEYKIIICLVYVYVHFVNIFRKMINKKFQNFILFKYIFDLSFFKLITADMAEFEIYEYIKK